MLFQIYLRRGLVYVPTAAIREGGVYTAIEPVAVVHVTKTEEVHQALLVTMARKNITVPVPRGKWPPPVLLKYAGVKTWSAFARDARTWNIEENDGKFQIEGYRTHAKGYWVEDPNQKIEFPNNTSIDTVIERMIGILQDADRQKT
jgi:hypothetical protein